MPKLSVGMPVYNGQPYLAAALDSVLGQDFEDFELIIADNASTDDTQRICKEYAARDRRIVYHRNESNIGSVCNYNRVFELARGQYFKWASHDDQCLPTMFRRCLEALDQAGPSAVLAFPKCEIIGGDGQVLGVAPDRLLTGKSKPHRRVGRLLHYIQYANPLWGMIRSDALRQSRRLVSCLLNDYVLLAELAMLGEAVEVPEPLFRLRIHQRNAVKLFRNQTELLAWHDASLTKKKRRIPPRLALQLEFFRSIRHVPLGPVDKALCFATVAASPSWRWFLRASGPTRQKFGLRRDQPEQELKTALNRYYE